MKCVVLHWMPLLGKKSKHLHQPDPRGSEREKGTSLQYASVTPLKTKKKACFPENQWLVQMYSLQKKIHPSKRLTAGFHKPPWRFGSDHFPFLVWVICRFQSLIFQGPCPFYETFVSFSRRKRFVDLNPYRTSTTEFHPKWWFFSKGNGGFPYFRDFPRLVKYDSRNGQIWYISHHLPLIKPPESTNREFPPENWWVGSRKD